MSSPLIALFAAALAITATAAAETDFPAGQLPQSATPRHYKLDLTILPDQDRFSGKVAIDVTLHAPSRLIWLHGQDLTVERAAVTDAGGSTLAATYEEIAGSSGVVRLSLPREIAAGPARIEIAYSGPFNRNLEGLYRSDEGGDSYAFTQMEPIFARLAFPSFDEPRFKTPFDTSITVRDSHVAITNAPETKVEALDNGLKRITFATSKPLPTYLVAFAVGPLDVVDWAPVRATALRDTPIPLRGITARGKGKQIEYALANTEALLLELEDYFGIAYPYEKLDLVAATDFAAGAMENAGAIFYREPLMLLDERSSLNQKRLYALVHAHELAHQWFGNLVTPAWWDDIWLNEAFATWMENKTAHAWDPQGEYGRLNQTGALSAMGTDSWRSARQIAQPILSNDDIANAFDTITYEKGGGVLSMFERYYGEETFRRGVTHYLEKFRWGVATSKDFFQSIADVAGDERGLAAFQSFINQPGVPTVKADLRCARSGARLRLSQSRYLVKPEAPHIDQRWQIPVCVASAGDGGQRQSTCALMTDRTMDVDLPGGACPAWVMPNADGAGYFRFSLDLDGWRSLIGNAEHLNAAELLSLLDSLDAAFTAGAIDTEVYADGVQAVMAAHPQGPAWDVLAAPLARLAWIEETLVADRAQAGVKAYTDQLYGPQFDAFGLDPTSARDRANPTTATLARTPLVNVMLNQVGRTDVSDELARRGSAFLGLSTGGAIDAAAVDANLLEPALTAAVRAHGTAAADLVERHLKTERNAIYRSRMLTALTRSTDPEVAARARALALSDDLRVNEVPIAVYGAVREAENIDAGWQWFKDNFDAIAARTPPNNRGELAEIGSRFCTKARREDYRRFFAPRIEALTGGPRTMAMVLERIDACILLVDQQRRKATKHFSTFQDGQS